MTEPTSNPLGTLQLAEPIPLPDLAARFEALLARISELHRAGRLHGSIRDAGATLDDRGRPTIGPPGERVFLSGENQLETPPELSARGSWDLPTDLAAARAQLAAEGFAVDPRRIDIYQLGVRLCSLVSGQSASDYLRSPKARGLVPPALRPVIDRALGHDANARLADCDEFAALVARAADQAARGWFEDTPAEGIQRTPVTLPPGAPESKSSAEPLQARLAEGVAGDLPFARLGAYRIIERIGGGGMGDVYKAHDEALDRIVAVKVLPLELARHADFVRRFRAEAMAIAKLTHPNIVQVYAFGEDAGQRFFAMQFVNGESMGELLRRRRRLPLDEALPIFEQCLAGLGAAHRRDLIHRDIKPGNILLDHEQNRALVADFGLVKTSESGDNLTASGVIMGTVDYLSPEQARGQHVDGRSDLYSLGALMYQTLSGRLPFVSDSATGLIFQHAFEQPQSLAEVAPDVPKQVVATVMRLMAKDPAQRYQTADDVLADLAAYRAGKPPVGAAEAKSKIIAAQDVASAGDGARRKDAASLYSYSPAGPVDRPGGGWRDRIRELWQANAPEAIRGLENTQQQVDGAVAEHERRRDQLAALARDAQAVAADFATQAAAHREAAQAAARRAAQATDPDAADKARQDQTKCERIAADFEAQLAEQTEQSDDIQLKLSKVNATLQQLRSQRDVLQARLRAAQARLGVEGARPRRRRLRVAPLAIGAGAVVLAGVILLGYQLSSHTQNKDIVATGAPAQTTPSRAASPVKGAPAIPIAAPMPDSNGSIDLLKLIEPDRDAVQGRWTLKQGVLTSPTASGAKLQVPYAPPSRYRLTIVGEREQGTNLSVGLVIGGKQAHVVFDAYNNGAITGLENIDGKSAAKNPTLIQSPRILGDGRPYTVIFDVRDCSVDVQLNDKPLLSWSGTPDQLSLPPYCAVPDTDKLFLGTKGIHHISMMTLSPLRPAPVVRPSAAPPSVAAPSGAVEASLIGRVTFQNQDAGVLVKYAAGRTLSGESILSAIKKALPEASPSKRIIVMLSGSLRVPQAMAVGVSQKGGSSTGGVHHLMVDGIELGSVGDDRSKNSFYSVDLPAGDHAVTWRLTGGVMGEKNSIEFAERRTGQPLLLFPSEADIAAAQSAPSAEVVDNLSPDYEPAVRYPWADRVVAEWALSVGGKVRVKPYRKTAPPISIVTDLPPEFHVIELDLANTNVTDADVSGVTALRQLGVLDLQSTRVTADGVARLEAALPECKILTPAEITSMMLEAARRALSPESSPTEALPAPATDNAEILPGLLMTEYARLPTQSNANGAFAPPEQLGDPLSAPTVIRSLSTWKYDPERNGMASGLLKIDLVGEYRFNSNNFYDRNALYVNGVPVCAYHDGEQKVGTMSLQPGLIPIASVGYVAARGAVKVLWAPPGQSDLSEIPADRLFHSATQTAKRPAELDAVEQTRATRIPSAGPVDIRDCKPGLFELSYARLPSQSSKSSMCVPPAEFGEPLEAPTPAGSFSPWKVDSKRNHIAFGYLRAERDGEYAFICQPGSHRMLYIDGKLLFDAKEGESQVRRIGLKAGLVPCMVVTFVQNPKIIVEWQPPGQAELSPIPLDAMLHDPAVLRPQIPGTPQAAAAPAPTAP